MRPWDTVNRTFREGWPALCEAGIPAVTSRATGRGWDQNLPDTPAVTVMKLMMVVCMRSGLAT